jgi:thymidylate synthase ThyX
MLTYEGDTFKIVMRRYSDPDRLNLAYNAATYLGKSDKDNIRRPLSIIKQGHVPEIFRGEHVEFEFIDVSKEVYDHFVTYTTRDMRVAGGNRALTSTNFTIPSDKMKDPANVWRHVNESFEHYVSLLESGETPQVARAAMPTAAKLNPFIYQFNFLTLMQSFFKQRIWEKGAQGNTVKVVRGMWELCHSQDPDLWDTAYDYFGTPMVEWREIRDRLRKHEPELYERLMKQYGPQKSMW